MGQLFGNLTQPGSALTDSSGNAAAIGNPSQIRDQYFKQSANFKPFADGGTTPGQSPLHNLGIGQPSFAQASTAGATPGGANAESPGLTKAGKLMTLLSSGLQGALAGRAKSEETVAATGGRRSGGAGMGFEAGYTLPWQRAGQKLGLEQQQAQVDLTKAQGQTVQTPQGPMPGWLARYIAPAMIREQGTEKAAQTTAQGRVAAAEVGQRFKAVPGVGLFDTSSRQVVPGTQQGVMITPEIAQDYQLPQEFIGKPMNVGQLATLERAQNSNLTTVQGAQGPALVNKGKGTAKDLGLGSPAVAAAQARPLPVVEDQENPGVVTYAPGGVAIQKKLQSPQGAATQAAKTEARSEVPTKIGDQKVAFNTAIAHADLLKKAFDSVGNGDVQLWNSIKNRAKTEFGWSEQPTARLIAEVYAGEINKIINAGHITQQELEKVGGTVPTDYASPGRMAGALAAYKALAQSKLDNLVKQASAAKAGNTGGKEIHYKIVNGQLVPQTASK